MYLFQMMVFAAIENNLLLSRGIQFSTIESLLENQNKGFIPTIIRKGIARCQTVIARWATIP